ncbi:MAG: putative nuclease of restriction endonuclease-like RecB superfamily [Kiritimatiellia bacterium]|jgi:predicted nuclease of restriction endonuclease-like RecB superfamily
MLTGDLLRARVRGSDVQPSFIDPKKKSLIETSGSLIELWNRALDERWSRGELQDATDELVGLRRDHKVLRGMAKVLLDRSEFEVISPIPPADLRLLVFERAKQLGPLSLTAGPFNHPTRDDVLQQIADELKTTPTAIDEALYADLKVAERLVTCKVPEPSWLLHRYNVALVQAILLRATEVRVRLHKPGQQRLRQLFRHIKFHQLMFLARQDGEWLEIALDGPASLFSQSTRYGLKLATFLPALLLQPGDWELKATVLWTTAKQKKCLSISSSLGLQSHYTDTGAYETQQQKWFTERFAAAATEWKLRPGQRPVDLGGQGVLLPDFELRKDGKVAYLEICGFWRHDSLSRKLSLMDRYGPGNVIVALSRKLRGSKGKVLPTWSGPTVEFAQIIPVAKVLAAAEQVAIAE